jgi:hypothetical protein
MYWADEMTPKSFGQLRRLFEYHLLGIVDDESEKCAKMLKRLLKCLQPAFILRAVDLEEFDKVVQHAENILKAGKHMETNEQVIINQM